MLVVCVFSVWSHHDRPGCCLHQNARSQTGHHLPPHVHLHCWQRKTRFSWFTWFTCLTVSSLTDPLSLFLSLQALKAIVAMDTAGVVLGWKFFDHAAHLGGALFGV